MNAIQFSHEHIFTAATYLVEKVILKQEEYLEEFWPNPTEDENGEDTTPQILQWYIVTEWGGKCLSKAGAHVVEFEGIHFWGRTTSGQAVNQDEVISEAAKLV
jgi:hypothetical protein